MKKREQSAEERKIVYEAIVAVRKSRNPKVAHVLPRKREIVEYTNLSEDAIKSAIHFLVKWRIVVRNGRFGWMDLSVPQYFCWSHGMDTAQHNTCDTCQQRRLRQTAAMAINRQEGGTTHASN